MTRPDLEDQDLALNISSVEVHAAGMKVCKLLCGSIPHALRIHTVGHHITLTLAITWLFVFAFNERNNHSKLESSHSSRSLSEGQDALDLLTEGVLCLQRLRLFILKETKNRWDNIFCIFCPWAACQSEGLSGHTLLLWCLCNSTAPHLENKKGILKSTRSVLCKIFGPWESLVTPVRDLIVTQLS